MANDLQLNIEYLPVDQLTPYQNNARKHQREDVGAIVESIKEFGFDDPIGVWGGHNVIVEGHGRLMAAKKLGMKQVPVIHLDHLSDEQRRAYALAHNRTAELSAWDEVVKELELSSITEIDMSLFGFDLSALEDDGEAVEDDYDIDAPVEARAKLGDIYQLGRHRLMCGDSTDVNAVNKLINDTEIELLLTDPPYGISVVKGNKVGGGGATHFGKDGGGNIVKSNTYSSIIGDDTTDTARESYDVAITCTKNQIIFGGNYFTDFLAPSRCWIVWDKQNTGNFADAELAWTSFDKGVKLYHYLWNGLCREGSRDIEGVSRVHPTQKPVGLIIKILLDFATNGGDILDLFGGSGSTLVACEQTGRTCYMMELDPHYVDVIIARWEELTGEKAILLNGL